MKFIVHIKEIQNEILISLRILSNLKNINFQTINISLASEKTSVLKKFWLH